MTESSWRARPYAELDATNDKKLLHLGAEQPDGFWPVFKGASFDLWVPDTGIYYGWADPDVLTEHLRQKRKRGAKHSRSPFSEFETEWVDDPTTLPCRSARLAFRDISRADRYTNGASCPNTSAGFSN